MINLPLTNNAQPGHGSAAAAASGPTSEEMLEKSPAGRKLLKATREFEADLITSWWQEAEKDMPDSGGGELGSGMDGLKNVAMNSLAENMVKAGGLGISRMIFHSLEPALRRKLEQETSAAAASGSSQPTEGQQDKNP
jgi:hypothetical protein